MAACCASETKDVDNEEEEQIKDYTKIELDENVPRMVQHFSELDIDCESEAEEKISDQQSVVQPGVKFNDVFGIDNIKEVLRTASTPPLTSKPILLYGLPGTGKTLLASAVVGEAHRGVATISVSAQDLGLKSLEKLLKRAETNSPAIFFIDNVHHLPVEAADLIASIKGVLVLGATNLPMDISDEILKVFPNRYHVAIPAVDGIANMMSRLVVDVAKSFNKQDFDVVVASLGSEQFSTSDLKSMIEQSVKENDLSVKSFTDKVTKLKENQKKKKRRRSISKRCKSGLKSLEWTKCRILLAHNGRFTSIHG